MAKILLVEDDENQGLLYKQELSDEGYEVEVVRDGREAVARISEVKPDLVVMDISMPGMDGIEAMSQILAQDNKLPVILNTAYASYKDDFRSWSADAYIVKSSDLSELKQKIHEVLERASS